MFKWMLRGVVTVFLLIISFTILVQTPYIQGYLIKIASEQATKSLGMEVEVGKIELSLTSKSIIIEEIIGKTNGSEITCQRLRWSDIWNNNGSDSEIGSVVLDTVFIEFQSLSDLDSLISSIGATDGDEKGNGNEYVSRSLLINNLIYEVADCIRIEIANIQCDNIKVRDSDLTINRWIIGNSSILIPEYDRIDIQNSEGFLSVINGDLGFKIDELNTEEAKLSADLKLNKHDELTITKLTVDGNALSLAKRFERSLDEKILETISNLNSDNFTCDISFLEEELIVNSFYNDQIQFSGKLLTNNDIDWAMKATIDSQIAESWTENLLEESVVIDLDVTGSHGGSKGYFASDLTSGEFTIDWSDKEIIGDVRLDSTWTSKGIVENFYAEFAFLNGLLEVNWESDLHDVSIEYDSWKLSSHLLGQISFHNDFKDASLTFTNPLLQKNSSTPPILSDVFNLNLVLNEKYLNIDIDSDILDSKGVVNIEEDTWGSWWKSAKRLSHENSNLRGLLTQGTCSLYKSEALVRMFDLPLKFADGTEAVWSLSAEKYQAEVISDWISINDVVVKDPVINISGGTSEYSLHAEISEINKNEALIAKGLEMELLGDTIWSYRCNWENSEETGGFMKIYGKKDKNWEFKLAEAIIPMGKDTLEFFDLTGSYSGEIDNPKISISGEGMNLSYANEIIPYTKFDLDYFEGQIKVDNKMSGIGNNEAGIIETKGILQLATHEEIHLDLVATLTDVPMSFANKLLDEKIAKLDGGLDAEFTILGTYQDPEIKGNGVLKDAAVGVTYLGTEYFINGRFNVLPDGIELNGIQVRDQKGGEAILVGTALHEGFEKWNLDISLNIEDETKPLEIMDISNSPDAYFYGTGKATGDINAFGYDGEITIEARLKTFEGTEFVLPMETATSSTWTSFIEFIDHSAYEKNDGNKFQKKTSVNLDLIIEVTEESQARIIFDEAVGDEIMGRCSGTIHLSLDDLERLSMFGALEIVEGDYLFTFYNFINKKFVAEPGGTIKWYGNPYEAEIDLKTYYSTRTSLLPINPESAAEGKSRVDLVLNLNGNLMRPGIKFDIELPESDSKTKATLATLISNEEEMNRQALSLLVLQQFLPPEWQVAAIGSIGLQENSTELISSQFGNWLSGISDDVNVGIDFDAGSKTGDESALAVALSTQLLDNRLHVEGEVGTDKLNTGAFEDLKLRDVRLRYDLNKDGSLQLTGYSTQRSTIPGLEGESVQGVGILFHRDFNKLLELFKKNI